MKRLTLLLSLFLFCALFHAAQAQDFRYPDNWRPAKEMVIDRDHRATEIEADRNAYRHFFAPQRRPERERYYGEPVTPHEKTHFVDKKNLFGIVKDIFRPENIFNYSPLTDQLSTPERLVTAASMGYLLDNDRTIYTDMDRDMKKSDFWQKNGNSITMLGNGVSEVALAGLLYVKGKEKDKQVAQMLMESALSLRVQYAKRLLGVSRPSDTVAHIGPHMQYDAFPSGHTWTAFSLATIIGEAYNLKWLTYPAALFTGLSRIQQNTHWPSDILAGGLLGHLEARHIMAKHGFIPTSKIREAKLWRNTSIDLDGDYTLLYDSNEKFNDASPETDNVGRLTWRWEARQTLSKSALLQVDYHYRGQVPNNTNYNSVEDVLTSPRLVCRIGKNALAFAQYTDNRVQFNDLGRSPHEPLRGIPPAGLDYVGEFGEKRSTAGFFFRLSPHFYLKPSYAVSDYVTLGYSDLYSRGGKARIELSTSPERQLNTDAYLSYADGYENARNARYSQKCREYHFELTQRLGKQGSLAFSYLGESRLYPDGFGTQSNTKSFWQVSGLEYRREFTDTWNAKLGVYRRSLASDVQGWSYRKNLYMLQLNKSF